MMHGPINIRFGTKLQYHTFARRQWGRGHGSLDTYTGELQWPLWILLTI